MEEKRADKTRTKDRQIIQKKGKRRRKIERNRRKDNQKNVRKENKIYLKSKSSKIIENEEKTKRNRK